MPLSPDGKPVPPAPWTCRCDALVWWTLPRTARLACGALLRYHATPVGEYRELAGVLGQLGRHGLSATVPFIAVDSPGSLVGGRRNWALPKTLAEFTGDPTVGSMTAAAEDWTVTATARVFGPAVPVRLAGRLAQPWPDGIRRTARLAGLAIARAAVVSVTVRPDDTLPGWLRTGRHLGVQLRDAEITFGPAEPS